MSFPTPHSGYILLLAGLAFFLFAIIMLMQQPARFVYIPATPATQAYPVTVPFTASLLNEYPASDAKNVFDKTDSFINNGVSPPECYEIARYRWVCSGFIYNSHEFTLYQPSITLNLHENDHFRGQKTVFAASTLLLPDEAAPYHVYIDGHDIEASVSISQYEISNLSSVNPLRLETTFINKNWRQSNAGYPVYDIHIELTNPYQTIVHDVWVIVSLLDERNTITAYRVFNLDKLAANTTETHTFRLISWLTDTNVRPYIMAEGLEHP
ncbi:MAG: hypothetical protein ACPG7F_08330 [Aggregatilineales bacterium]